MVLFRFESRVSFRSRNLAVDSEVAFAFGGASEDRLAAELAQYRTPGELRDLEAALDRYPDDETDEIRALLAGRDHAG
jgi:hypothetical protein